MFKQLESDNLILNSMSHEDDAFILELFTSDLLTQYLGAVPNIHNLKDAIRFVNEYMDVDSKIKHIYVISLKNSSEKIGIVYLAHLDTLTSTIEINCSIRPSLWKKGYASEALERVIRFVKEDLNMNMVYSYLDPNNESGVRTLQKLGFYRSNEQRYIKASGVPTLHDIYYRPLFTRNSYQREFLNEGPDVSDNHDVILAKEEFSKNPTKENNLKVVDALYVQFKHHDALSFIKDDEDDEQLLYKKALICMKINRLNDAKSILEFLLNNYKRINYCYKLVLVYYYLKDYKNAYELLKEWYDVFDDKDEKMAALFWIMACSIKLGYDNSFVKKLFFKYKGESKTGYYLAIRQYLFDDVEIDIEGMNDIHRSVIYYAASLFDEDNRKMYLEKVLTCINPWGSSCFLAALYESK